MNVNKFNVVLKSIQENSMFPEDWEDLIFSDDLTFEEVLYIIMFARMDYFEK